MHHALSTLSYHFTWEMVGFGCVADGLSLTFDLSTGMGSDSRGHFFLNPFDPFLLRET